MVGGKPDDSSFSKCFDSYDEGVFAFQANHLPCIAEERGLDFERFGLAASGVVNGEPGGSVHSNLTQAGATTTSTDSFDKHFSFLANNVVGGKQGGLIHSDFIQAGVTGTDGVDKFMD